MIYFVVVDSKNTLLKEQLVFNVTCVVSRIEILNQGQLFKKKNSTKINNITSFNFKINPLSIKYVYLLHMKCI